MQKRALGLAGNRRFDTLLRVTRIQRDGEAPLDNATRRSLCHGSVAQGHRFLRVGLMEPFTGVRSWAQHLG